MELPGSRALITISDRSRSAVAALIALNCRGCDHPVPILEIAEERGIALHVLEQQFASLRRAGILKSQRGVRGGYSFARDAGEISVLDVVECIDGPLRPAADAPAAGQCIWTDARAELCKHLDGVSIADLAEREAQASGSLMFHI